MNRLPPLRFRRTCDLHGTDPGGLLLPLARADLELDDRHRLRGVDAPQLRPVDEDAAAVIHLDEARTAEPGAVVPEHNSSFLSVPRGLAEFRRIPGLERSFGKRDRTVFGQGGGDHRFHAEDLGRVHPQPVRARVVVVTPQGDHRGRLAVVHLDVGKPQLLRPGDGGANHLSGEDFLEVQVDSPLELAGVFIAVRTHRDPDFEVNEAPDLVHQHDSGVVLVGFAHLRTAVLPGDRDHQVRKFGLLDAADVGAGLDRVDQEIFLEGLAEHPNVEALRPVVVEDQLGRGIGTFGHDVLAVAFIDRNRDFGDVVFPADAGPLDQIGLATARLCRGRGEVGEGLALGLERLDEFVTETALLAAPDDFLVFVGFSVGRNGMMGH